MREATAAEIKLYVAYKQKYGIDTKGAMTPGKDDFHFALLIENIWLMPYAHTLGHFSYQEIYKIVTSPKAGHVKTYPSRFLGNRSWEFLKSKLGIN